MAVSFLLKRPHFNTGFYTRVYWLLKAWIYFIAQVCDPLNIEQNRHTLTTGYHIFAAMKEELWTERGKKSLILIQNHG